MTAMAEDLMGSRDINTYLPYLAKDEIYTKEKPFGADFPVDRFQGSQLANHVFDNKQVIIHDVRNAKSTSLEINGFCFLKAETSLKATEATNTKTEAVEAYLAEVERILYNKFPEYSRIEVMDFQVRPPSEPWGATD